MSTSQRLRVRFAGLAALLMIGTATASAQQWEDRIGFGSLFVAAEPPRRVWKTGTAAAVLRERFVRLDQDVLEAARVNAGRADLPPTIVRLTLFDDVVLNAVVERTGPSSSGYWLSGRIEEWPLLGSITLAVNGDVIAGTVRTPGATYAIRSVDDNMQAIRQLDPGALPTFEDDSLPPAPPTDEPRRVQPLHPPVRSTKRQAEVPPEEDGSRIDVLVVYTPFARDDAGGRAEIETLIDLRVAETNQAYANSGVIQRIHLVWTAEVDYTEVPRSLDTQRTNTIEHLIDPSDGYMDEVHAMRDRYAADLVHLVVDNRFNTGGEAKRLRDLSSPVDAASRHAFTISKVHVGSGSVIFAHELGHSMGLAHDRYAELHVCCSGLNKVYPYSHGYVNQRAFESDAPPESYWRTIMSYPSQCDDVARLHNMCVPVLRFSNPELTYNGDPTGVPGDRPSSSVAGPADARRSLNNTRRFVANFRRAPCLRSSERIRLQASNGQYVVAVGNGGGEVLAVGSHLGPWGEFTLVDADGGCVDSGDAVSLHTSDGFYLRAQQGGGSTLDATDPQATPWAQFVARRYRGTGAIRKLDSMTLQVESGHYVCAEEGGGGSVRADCDSHDPWATFKVSAADATSTYRNWLVGGQRLMTGQSIRAEGAACRLVFQTDGNLVAYNEGVAYWHSRTAGAATGGSTVMQSDGNFVVYDAAGVARWSTGTGGIPGAFLLIESDCNVVLRSAGGAALWSTGQPR